MRGVLMGALTAAVLLGGTARAADVLDTAAAIGQARTLVEAADSVGLSDSLRAKGPFTVFAPTDDAWAQLPAPTVERLLDDPKLLAEVLKYHIVPGKIHAAELRPRRLPTAQGAPVQVAADEQGVSLAGARIVRADVEADNGVVYLIDKVIFPAERGGR